ncbi:MAG: hypothetical protein JXQ73_20755, partial [Phycisphaerae bacterium]|nr:hypothetical protein [Phycisphaerae bacterium]
PNLEKFDGKLGSLAEKLNFPVGSPIALVMGQLGIADGLRQDGGLGIVVLDPMEYGTPPEDLAILVPTTNCKALLEVFEPQDAGDGVMTIDIMGQQLYAVPKGGFVVLGMDKASATFVAKSKKGIKESLKPAQIERYKNADLFVWVNLRPAIEMAKPLAGQVFAMLMMDQMDGDPKAAERIQEGAQTVVDLLDQIHTLEIAMGLDDAGMQLTFFLTFQEDGAIAKKFAADKSGPTALLTGLPMEPYVMAMGLKGSESGEESTFQKMIMDLLMSRPEVGQVLDKEKMQVVQKMGREIMSKLGSMGFSLNVLPEGGDGMIGLAQVWETKDVKGTIAQVQKIVEAYKGVFKDEKAASILKSLTCKPGAEKIGDVAVDHITLDLKAAAGDDPDMQGVVGMVEKILGKEGVLVRMAPAGDKHVAVTLGGGIKRLEQVVKSAAAGSSPLAEDPGVMKVRKKLPKKRAFEMYLSVDQLLKIVKTVMGSEDVPVMTKIDAPLGISLATEQNYGRLDLVLPTELIIEIKNVALAAMFGGGFGGGGQSAQPSF